MRRSAARAGRAPWRRRRLGARRASASRAKTSTGRVAVAPGVVEDRASRSSAPGTPSRRRARRAGSRRARPALRRRRRGATPPPPRAPPAPRRRARARAGRGRDGRGRARPAARRRWPRPSRSRAPASPRRPRSRRPGTARGRGSRAGRPRSAGSRAVPTSPPPGRCADGVVEAVLDAGQLAEHRVAADVQPRVVDDARASAATWSRASRGARAVAGRDRGAGGEERVRGLVPRPVEPVVERAAAVGERQRLLPLAVVRHDVGEVVGAARLQVGVVDRVGELGRGGDVPAGGLEVARRRLDPGGEQERGRPGRAAGAASPAASSAARSRCAPRLSPRTIHAQPNPLAMRERAQRVVRRAPGQRGVDVGALGPGEREVLGLPRAAHALRSTTAAASANHAACAARRALGQPGLGHRLERERADAVEQPVARRARRRRRSPASGSRAGRPRRSPPPAARRARRARTRPPAAARRRRTWPAPRGRAGRRGTAGRSSTRSSPCSARRRSGLRLVGSLSTVKRSSRRRAISSTDSVLVRAAASSIASGRPSSERHSSRTSLRRRPAGRGAAGEQLDGVGERERRELEHGLAVDVERRPGWCTGSAAPGAASSRRSASAAAASTTCSQLSRISTAPARLEPLEQRRLAAGDAQRGDHRVEDVVGGLRGLEPGEPDAGHVGQRAPGRDRERRLADPARADDLDEPAGAQQVATARRSRRRGRRARPPATAGSRAARRAERAPVLGRGSAARAPAAAGRARGRARRRAGSRTRW